LPDLGPGLFQRLVLEVVPLEQFSLFFRELLNGRTHPAAHLLELDFFICREGLIADLKALTALKAGREDHGKARYSA